MGKPKGPVRSFIIEIASARAAEVLEASLLSRSHHSTNLWEREDSSIASNLPLVPAAALDLTSLSGRELAASRRSRPSSSMRPTRSMSGHGVTSFKLERGLPTSRRWGKDSSADAVRMSPRGSCVSSRSRRSGSLDWESRNDIRRTGRDPAAACR
eukprot:scaffold923_cov256-Pinguiococcus_pyrenoidosus.AAC.2